jgi:hypothetical protein
MGETVSPMVAAARSWIFEYGLSSRTNRQYSASRNGSLMWNCLSRSGVMAMIGHKSTLLPRNADSEVSSQYTHSRRMPRRPAAVRTRSIASPVG